MLQIPCTLPFQPSLFAPPFYQKRVNQNQVYSSTQLCVCSLFQQMRRYVFQPFSPDHQVHLYTNISGNQSIYVGLVYIMVGLVYIMFSCL